MTAVAIVSDIHLREGRTTAIAELLDTMGEQLAQHDIAHTFVLGDLVEDSDPQTDRHHIELVESIFSDWASPVTYLLGNHDILTLSTDTLGAILGQDRFYGVETVNGHPFVYLNSTAAGISNRGCIGPEQRTWLAESLPEDAIVLSHHPLGQFSLADNVWFQTYPERGRAWDRKEVLTILSDRARATVSGHIHQSSQCLFEGLKHFSINAVSKETPSKPVSGHYGVLSFGNDGGVQLERYSV